MAGDLGTVQSVAKDIAFLVDDGVRRKRAETVPETMNSLFDAWLRIEHPKVWNAVHEGEEAGVDKGMSADLSSDSMTGLMAQLMAQADAEADMWDREHGN